MPVVFTELSRKASTSGTQKNTKEHYCDSIAGYRGGRIKRIIKFKKEKTDEQNESTIS